MVDTGESGPDVDSPPSPHRLAVWSWVDQGAIFGKVSPSSAAPQSPGTGLTPSQPETTILRSSAAVPIPSLSGDLHVLFHHPPQVSLP